ncbi:enoyl-CoA hydratase/isomerase family protein [Halomicrococcus sp. NG-SE-24]|uniref:enoyl-CoA hydratase/isomerase family protein n=1 Tax=Halomicrococcus sp. NG-SE-24 TaxID=3436928 RepID=UPI003D99477C
MSNAVFDVTDGVATVEIRRPDALNAMDSETKRDIIDRVREYRHDDGVRVVVFRGAGEDAFCAGGDLKEVRETDYSLAAFTETWQELFDALRRLGKPTVAQVDGVCLGGGFDLMLHVDFVVATDDATIGQPEASLGIVNHFSPPMLREMVGWRRALDLVMTGEPVDGAEAERIGLVTRSVPRSEVEEEVASLTASLLEKSPRVLRKLKTGFYETMDMPPAAAKDHLGRIAHEAAREDPDYREGVDAQLDGRDPEWET